MIVNTEWRKETTEDSRGMKMNEVRAPQEGRSEPMETPVGKG